MVSQHMSCDAPRWDTCALRCQLMMQEVDRCHLLRDATHWNAKVCFIVRHVNLTSTSFPFIKRNFYCKSMVSPFCIEAVFRGCGLFCLAICIKIVMILMLI
ncbi:hypothetical protein GDO78_020912 [Eleutherodactylus coqui]|uniref:Uncharacterized protein n=1 Tax=Eleutherodactylus coqui TaxID=57060 RepID=A0A8J6EHF8_ELECQ|nr:hypothetical protein GDO78_020912 [Eleutherodactylus coqui]